MTLETRKKMYEHFKRIGRHDAVLEAEFGKINAPFPEKLPQKEAHSMVPNSNAQEEKKETLLEKGKKALFGKGKK